MFKNEMFWKYIISGIENLRLLPFLGMLVARKRIVVSSFFCLFRLLRCCIHTITIFNISPTSPTKDLPLRCNTSDLSFIGKPWCNTSIKNTSFLQHFEDFLFWLNVLSSNPFHPFFLNFVSLLSIVKYMESKVIKEKLLGKLK